MAARTKSASPKAAKPSRPPIRDEVRDVLAWLEENASSRYREEMGPRYGIHTDKAFGVPMAKLKVLAKRLGRSHELAAALWETGWYDARLLASLVDEPERVTATQMDAWCHEFDNWGVCDTVCFALFDRTPHAFRKVTQWARRREEFEKRAAFALLASLALHDKRAPAESFIETLSLIEDAASDDRNFVKKAVSWALRAIGGRDRELNAAAVSLAQRLAESPQPAARWVGRDALRSLTGPVMSRRLARRSAAPPRA